MITDMNTILLIDEIKTQLSALDKCDARFYHIGELNGER